DDGACGAADTAARARAGRRHDHDQQREGRAGLRLRHRGRLPRRSGHHRGAVGARGPAPATARPSRVQGWSRDRAVNGEAGAADLRSRAMDKTDNTGTLDLLVRGGTLVIPGVGQVRADLGIAGGKIVALGENLSQPAAETYDATGRTVLPGIFDPHIHIGNEQSYESEAETETRAAILGG